MGRYTLEFTEKVSYTRTLTVTTPEDITDTQLESLLDDIERNSPDSVDEYASILKRAGIDVDYYDFDYSSPDSQEVTCDSYDEVSDENK